MDVKRFRQDFNLGQKDIAAVFGCKQANVSAIENGSRSITPLQIRLLIEKYGFEVISKYADPAELPSSIANVTAPVIHGNNNPVNGSGTQNISGSDQDIIVVLKTQASQIASLIQQQNSLIQHQNSLIQHQDRLITLLESKK